MDTRCLTHLLRGQQQVFAYGDFGDLQAAAFDCMLGHYRSAHGERLLDKAVPDEHLQRIADRWHKTVAALGLTATDRRYSGEQQGRQDAVLIAMDLDACGQALSVDDLDKHFQQFARLWGVLSDKAQYSDLVMNLFSGLM